ncbi:MAG TPA: protein phosphatase 2C domain-containing protein [Ktedonobacterales bacterium]|nr:protein phosphatase 2C domain-containing protein [Ktedonobacterales bacterium]
MRSGKSWGRGGTRAAGLALACALALVLALPGVAGTALAAPTSAAARADTPAHPPLNVAYARVAVVRVLTSYYGATSGAGLIPALNQCAGTGVIVGATGSNLNSFTYVLLPTALVNPINPCQGVKTTFTQFNGTPRSWGIIRIQVLLDAAYTGTGSQHMGSVTYTIDPAQIHTTGTASGPKLLALPLSIPSGSPTHDLPVLQTPQASDAPPDPSTATFIDLTGQDGGALNRDSLLKSESASKLYPAAFPASQVFTQAAPASTATAAPAATGSPSAKPTAAPRPKSTATPQPTALATQLSLGAVEVDGNGRLIGMIGPDDQGNHILYGVSAINAAIGGVTGKPGPLMTQWSQGLVDFYANPPKYGSAHTAFAQLLQSYPDFAGAQPWADAAAQQSDSIPALTGSQGGSGPPTGPGVVVSGKSPLLFVGGAAVAVLLGLIGVMVLFARQRRGRRAAPAFSRADEAMLDLLPPDMALDDVPDQPTIPISTVGAALHGPAGGVATPARSVAIDELATARVSAIPRVTTAPRALSILTPRSAGLIHPGVKRASEPNQDNIFALEGIRQEVGRLQPFGLFIVADGMGGHLNGQLASRMAIETIARSVVRALTSAQRIEPAMPRDLLAESVRSAHLEIQRRNRENAGDMGSTVTAALLVDDHAYVINVGDSRTYLLNPDSGLKQITTDHSIVASLAASGVIKPEDIYIHPRRNQIYRSLGGEDEQIEVDAFEQELQAGDRLLLCSDGLWEMVRDPQIANILRGAVDPAQAVELLVREANANGGEDNIGVVVARMIEGLPPGAAPGMRMVAGPTDSDQTGGGGE